MGRKLEMGKKGILAVAFLTVLSMVACSGDHEVSPATVAGPPPEPPSFVKMTSSRELLNYLGVVLNYDSGANTGANNTLNTQFANLYPTLPQNGDSPYSGSASRMLTNFVFGICRGSLAQEAGITVPANRTVFRHIDLVKAPNSAVDRSALEGQTHAFIRHLAQRFYGSPIEQDEFAEIAKFYEAQRSTVAQNATGAQELAAQICGLIGSTPRALMKAL